LTLRFLKLCDVIRQKVTALDEVVRRHCRAAAVGRGRLASRVLLQEHVPYAVQFSDASPKVESRARERGDCVTAISHVALQVGHGIGLAVMVSPVAEAERRAARRRP